MSSRRKAAREKALEAPEPAAPEPLRDVRARFPRRCWQCQEGPLPGIELLCSRCRNEWKAQRRTNPPQPH